VSSGHPSLFLEGIWLAAAFVFLGLSGCNNGGSTVSGTTTPVLLSISISGPASVRENETAVFTATATWDDSSTTPVTPTWALDQPDYASVGTDGLFAASLVPASREVSLSASYTHGPVTQTASQTVTIINRAVPSGLSPVFVSPTSVRPSQFATDGKWLVWTADDRLGIYSSDGVSTKNLTRNLALDYYPDDFVFDGRFTAFTTLSRREIFYIDNQDESATPALVFRTSSYVRTFDIRNGELVWIEVDGNKLYYANLNSSPIESILISEGSLTKEQLKIDGGLIVWSEGGIYSGMQVRVYYYDLRAEAPTVTQLPGQTGSDHSLPSVHNRVIAWQGRTSDGTYDLEIFYCDLSATPLVSVQLTNNNTQDQNPQVYDGIIAWENQTGANSTICYINWGYLSITAKLCGAPIRRFMAMIFTLPTPRCSS
jgi:hypothetical protein